MQKRKEDRVFKHYFIMYFLVLLIPMIICCTYYSYMFFVINADDISSRKNDLVHAAARFDAVASEVAHLADSLVSKAEVNIFKNMTDVMVYPNTHKINELQTALPDLYHDNQEMYNYFIFFDNSEVVINKSIAYTYEQFYTLYMSKKDVGSFENWKTELAREGRHYGFLPLQEYDMHKTRTSKPVDKLLAYTRPISAFDGAETGYVYIFLDDDVIDSNMPVPEKNSILTIQDFAGNLLYCKDESGLGNYNEELIALLEGLDEKQSFTQKKLKLQ